MILSRDHTDNVIVTIFLYAFLRNFCSLLHSLHIIASQKLFNKNRVFASTLLNVMFIKQHNNVTTSSLEGACALKPSLPAGKPAGLTLMCMST